MPATITINVANIAAALASFNVIRVKRSISGAGGAFSLLTANSPQRASVTPPTEGPWAVNTKTLQLQVDTDPVVSLTFSGSNPLNAATVATQINAALGEGVTVATETEGVLALTSAKRGTISKIKLVGGSSLGDFGWTAGDQDVGEDAHVQLSEEQTVYKFTDNDGQADYYYKAQFFNIGTGLGGDDSPPFVGEAGVVVDEEILTIGTVDLINGSGVALGGQRISLYVLDQALSVGSKRLITTRQPITVVTDNAGHAEVSLIRGCRLKVVLEGTSFIREFTVPDEDTFNLLDAVSDSQDPFQIATIPFPAAIRRTL